MATITARQSKDGTKSYRARVRLNGQKAASATFARLTDARKWAQSTESQIREDRYFPNLEARKHTGNHLVDRYMVDVFPRKKD